MTDEILDPEGKPIKLMSPEIFRKQGYLQELNRRFLHPLGLALYFKRESEGEDEVGGIWDYRNEPGGFIFGDLSDPESLERTENVAMFAAQMYEQRRKRLGFIVEPVPGWPDECETVLLEMVSAGTGHGVVLTREINEEGEFRFSVEPEPDAKPDYMSHAFFFGFYVWEYEAWHGTPTDAAKSYLRAFNDWVRAGFPESQKSIDAGNERAETKEPQA